MRETRELVLSILQGRPMEMNGPPEDGSLPPMTPESQALRERYDPPDYDDESTEDLPEGIQGIFERERQELADLRLLRTEREVLAAQLDEARAQLTDPQGPAFDASS